MVSTGRIGATSVQMTDLRNRLNVVHDDVIHSSPINLVNVDRETDCRARLPVNEDVGEHRRAGDIKAGRNQKAARNGNGLDSLVDGTGADALDVDGDAIFDHAGNGAGNGRGR